MPFVISTFRLLESRMVRWTGRVARIIVSSEDRNEIERNGITVLQEVLGRTNRLLSFDNETYACKMNTDK
jgi:hypothetical protein